MTTITKNSHLCLIDASGYIFRAYHALPPLTRGSDGLPVGAVAGFCAMLHKLLLDIQDEKPPVTHIAAIFDASGRSFRNDLYKDYKAHRPPPPEDLVPQFPLTRRAAQAFGITTIEQKNLEADDIIASYARAAEKNGARVSIISSDKDMMQLIGKKVQMIDTMKNRTIGISEVEEKFGVPPEKVTDVQALIGDASDNVPGAPGIGIKSAAKLIAEHGSIKELLKNPDKIENKRWREIITSHQEQIEMSHLLVCLKEDADLPLPMDKLALKTSQADQLIGFLQEMEFVTLTRRIADKLDIDIASVKPQKKPSAAKKTKSKKMKKNDGGGGQPGYLAHPPDVKVDYKKYELITSLEDLDKWLDEIYETGFVAVDTETDSLNAMRAQLAGISCATAPNRACYIPLGHDEGLLSTEKQLPRKAVLAKLKKMLEDPSILKILHNAKYDMLVLRKYDIRINPIDDTMLLSYALDAGRHRHGLDALASQHFSHRMISYEDVTGKGTKKISFKEVPLEEAKNYAAEDADITLRLHIILRARLMAEKKVNLYQTLERPLAPVLVDMEEAGIKIDAGQLADLSRDFEAKTKKIAKRAFKLAGEEFNLASPKQVSDILFAKMNLAGGRKTKTGQWSTGASVLEDLAAAGHDLPRTILDWRHLAKLKTTYTDALPNFVHPETGRVHTSYAMASTSTGRLSSSDPNLQNIPIRSQEGRQIRQAFIAERGKVLISADYSQIELRLLAHMADVEALKSALSENADIHAMTAAEIFGIPLKQISPDERRSAKAINFGIIYGMSSFGLARQLAIPVGEADAYIKSYFRRFPGIKEYMEATKEMAREIGYVETIFGRRCHFPHIRDKNAARRNFSERAAINAPIQGSAADLIRRAMIFMPAALAQKKLATTMLLQVHDELVFEAPQKEAKKAGEIIAQIMREAAEPAVYLSVKLDVAVKAAKNWDEAH